MLEIILGVYMLSGWFLFLMIIICGSVYEVWTGTRTSDFEDCWILIFLPALIPFMIIGTIFKGIILGIKYLYLKTK